MTNRLAAEASPYLRQHAHNPVDWYPWGQEALGAARRQDRPILLSVGYAACHWCHVMAHESFADPTVAGLMNEHFVCIKVDREEYPDVDAIYQTICQAATGQGGWPLTVFLTPDLEPFYVGTYFPPRPRYGRPGFRDVLGGLARAWEVDRPAIRDVAREWTDTLRRVMAPPLGAPDAPGPELLAASASAVLGEMDPLHGGFGSAPKFPNAPCLELLLRVGGRSAQRAVFTLQCMAGGGMYDQLGGGFHRYSVDEAWQVPHFEKMLYDNAVLVPVYLDAYQVTGDAELARVARETLEYLQRDLRTAEGAFCCSEDADSPGPDGRMAEGAFYTWTPQEVRQALGDTQQAEAACRHFGISEAGNFEAGRSIPHLHALSASPAEAATLRAALHLSRQARPRPARDDKVLAGWNGLCISAFARAARVLGDQRYRACAEGAATFAIAHLRRPDGGLWRRWHEGRAEVAGTLEDYAGLALGLSELYEATFEPGWLALALDVARQAVQRFWEPAPAAFYLTEQGRTDLLTRPRDDGDSGPPAAQSLCVRALLRLSPYTEDPAFRDIPAAVFARSAGLLRNHPRGVGSLLCALALALHGPVEVVLALPPQEWLDRLNGRYLPDMVISRCEPGGLPDGSMPPAWRDRGAVDGRSTIWVCRDAVCRPPAHSWPEAEPWILEAGSAFSAGPPPLP